MSLFTNYLKKIIIEHNIVLVTNLLVKKIICRVDSLDNYNDSFPKKFFLCFLRKKARATYY